jgi:serine phosphatase RsbU (regulator of sigma subunit)
MDNKENIKGYSKQYIKNLVRIVFLASVSIFLAVVVTGVFGYMNTRSSLISKAKSQDIVFIVKSMGARIEGRISRAIETSQVFAKDPMNIKWVQGEESDETLGKVVLKKLDDTAKNYDYSNLFIVGAKSKHYYFSENSNSKEDGGNYVTLSESNPADNWFFERVKIKKEVALNVDYNDNYDKAVDGSFLFVNTFMGNVDNPVGICGVGLSLSDISKEFKEFKVGEKSNLWMVDESGIIKLSDAKEDVGKNYNEFLPAEVINKIQTDATAVTRDVKVSEYVDKNNATMDYAYYKLNSTDWILLYRIPRAESLSLLVNLKNNMIIAVIIILLCFIMLFYTVSKKIADPYKQALLINKELEDKVNIRTRELKESNEKIMDSIEYAKRLQESILPSELEIKKFFKDSFILWKPRDIVGGDFYWFRQIQDLTVLVVGDCTGHGVPGALMTMTVNAILHNIVADVGSCEPAFILKELHKQLKKSLNKDSNSESVDDGLDVAIFCFRNKEELSYVGANLELLVKDKEEIRTYKPRCKGIGYNYIELKDDIESDIIKVKEEDTFFITTDGFIHQNGGNKNYPFGKKRLIDILKENETKELNLIKAKLEGALESYMGEEVQRDDITLFGFKVK